MYHFIVEQDSRGTKRTKRQKAIQISDARRHAAIVVAERRRKGQRALTRETSSKASSCPKPDPVISAAAAAVESRISCPSSHSSTHFCSYCRAVDTPSSCGSSEAVTPGPVALLSQNTTDPFFTFPKRQLPKPIREVLNYAFTSLWPSMICDVRGKDLANAQTEWRMIPLEEDLLWHVQAYLATNLAFALGRIPENGHMREKFANFRLKHHTGAIQHVQKALERVDSGEIPEQLLMSILVLGVSAEVDETPLPETHPRSPLATHQALHVYGKFLLMPHYKRALDYLIKVAGGCHAFNTMALGDFILSSDLKHATRLGTPLEYAPIRPYRSVLRSGKHIPDTEAKGLALVLGSGFQSCSFIRIELLEGVQKAVNATVALDHYHRHENNWPRLDDVCIEANQAHRDFLNFIETPSAPTPSTSQLLSTACRAACLIYSDMVLYPMPPAARVKPRLAFVLWEALQSFEYHKTHNEPSEDEREQCCDVLSWIALMGACAAEHTAYRALFVEFLARNLKNRMLSWHCFEVKMSSFLWWGFVCEEPAKRAWSEAWDLLEKTVAEESMTNEVG